MTVRWSSISPKASWSSDTSLRLRAISVLKFFSAILVISFFAVRDTMHEHGVVFNIEQHSIVAATQAVVTIEIGQPLNISLQCAFET